MEILAELLPRRPGSVLLLVGDGPDRTALERRAKQLGIREQVLFYGRAECPEDLLCAMDVFLLPSLFEGLAVAAVEAQGSGLPVICAAGLSEEIRLTEDVRFLPLSVPSWVDVLAELPIKTENRENAVRIVANAGFDINSTARYIRSIFMGELS